MEHECSMWEHYGKEIKLWKWKVFMTFSIKLNLQFYCKEWWFGEMEICSNLLKISYFATLSLWKTIAKC